MNHEIICKIKDFVQIRDGVKPYFIGKDLGKVKPGDTVILVVDGFPVRVVRKVSCVDYVGEDIVIGFKAVETVMNQYGENNVSIRNAGNITFNL